MGVPVVVTDGNGCTATDAVTITVNDLTVSLVGDQSFCEAVTDLELTANVNGGQPDYDYDWSVPGTGSSITISLTETTTISVTVTDDQGCTVTSSVTVVWPSSTVAGIHSEAKNPRLNARTS